MALRSRWLVWIFVTLLGLAFFYYTFQGFSQVIGKGEDMAVIIQSPNQGEEEAAGASSPGKGQEVAAVLPPVPESEAQTNALPAPGEFFAESRMERDRVRGQQIDLLREIVQDPNSPEDSRKEAQAVLLQLGRHMEQEMETERLIVAKGFKDAVVFIQPQAVTVVVQAKSLSQGEVARISDLVGRSTGFKLEDMVIMPKE